MEKEKKVLFEVKFRCSNLIEAQTEEEAQEKTIQKFNNMGFPMATFVIKEIKPYK